MTDRTLATHCDTLATIAACHKIYKFSIASCSYHINIL